MDQPIESNYNLAIANEELVLVLSTIELLEQST